MAGEMPIRDWSLDNIANVNFSPNVVVDIDATNSTNTRSGAVLASTGSTVAGSWIGVSYDQSKLDSTGAVVKNSGIAVRTNGIAKITCTAAITAGQYVVVSNTTGGVGPATQTAGGAVPKAIVGRALNTTSASGDLVLVYLMPGATF